jgi:secernin
VGDQHGAPLAVTVETTEGSAVASLRRLACVCDTVVVVEPDRVLFAKNSDRDPNEAQLLDWQPRQTHVAGARVRCTWIEIDQVAETCAVLLSRPFWMWGAEIGANEHGVAIGNEAVFTDQPYAATGLTGMDLLRLALERSDSAAQAVEVITDLLERHGQGGGCGHEKRDFRYHNSFIVADPHGAYVLETAGRLWAVERVSAGARSISNGLTITGFAAHGDRLHTHFSRCRSRQALTLAGARRASGVADLMALLRDHGRGGPVPDYSLLTGAMAAPCMHAGGVAGASQSTASWVAELRAGGASSHWVTGTSAPCTSLFKPVQVTSALDLGPEAVDRYDDRSVWWRHELLHRRVMADPARLLPHYEAERDEVEADWVAAPPEPSAAFATADELTARWTRGVWADTVHDTRPIWARRYWRIRDRRAGLPGARGPSTPLEEQSA